MWLGGLSVKKGGRFFKFDIRVETPKGVLWCVYIQRPEVKGEVAAGMSNDIGDNQPNKSVQELTPAIKMSIEWARAILGHSSEGKTQQTAAALGILITRGALKTCESCARLCILDFFRSGLASFSGIRRILRIPSDSAEHTSELNLPGKDYLSEIRRNPAGIRKEGQMNWYLVPRVTNIQ